MTLKAIIPSGQTEITVNGLHQWDYGQKLEIHSADLGAIVEVHFACAGMKEAVVRVCDAVDGTAVTTIPDRCLEQTTPITAWVFEKNEKENATVGLTTKTITLPIIPRTKPQSSVSVPEDHADTYSELIAAVNKAVGKLTDGTVKVHYAYNADHASSATDADNASTALRATEADHATKATTVSTARKTVTLESKGGDTAEASIELDEGSTYIFYATTGTLSISTFVLQAVKDSVTYASNTVSALHHILSYNHLTKRLMYRRQKNDGSGSDYIGEGFYTFNYAKIANLI